jgi:hypothetical protein
MRTCRAPRVQPTRLRGRARDERGIALLEAAIVTPLFFALVFAVIEGGFALHERLSVANMALAGARTATGQGSDVLADYYVLQAIRAGAGGVSTAQVTAIVVYRAASATAHVPAGCKAASLSGSCNRYVGSDLTKDSAQFGCVGPPGPTAKVDRFWCPTGRKTALAGVNGPPDYVGVYVEATHRNLTGTFGSGVTFRSDTVMRIEPRTLT